MPLSPARHIEVGDATVHVFPDAESGSQAAGELIAKVIRTSVESRGKAVLGLATGSSPIRVYKYLRVLHAAGELSFADVTTYNLDEYYPMAPNAPQSYRRFMAEHLFDEIGLPANRAHLLDGTVPEAFAADHAAAYDRWIKADGGLDLQLLGIGRNGHIGFNEPSELSVQDCLELPTRLAELDPITIQDAVKDFDGREDLVPKRALTMGIAPILAARSIILLAFGDAKASAVNTALMGPVSSAVPASLLQTVSHKVTWILDEKAAAKLD